MGSTQKRDSESQSPRLTVGDSGGVSFQTRGSESRKFVLAGYRECKVEYHVRVAEETGGDSLILRA